MFSAFLKDLFPSITLLLAFASGNARCHSKILRMKINYMKKVLYYMSFHKYFQTE